MSEVAEVVRAGLTDHPAESLANATGQTTVSGAVIDRSFVAGSTRVI